jgi:hypothetical protein
MPHSSVDKVRQVCEVRRTLRGDGHAGILELDAVVDVLSRGHDVLEYRHVLGINLFPNGDDRAAMSFSMEEQSATRMSV